MSLNLCCLELVKNIPLYIVTVMLPPWHSRMSLWSLVLHLISRLIRLFKVLLCLTPNVSLGWMDGFVIHCEVVCEVHNALSGCIPLYYL